MIRFSKKIAALFLCLIVFSSVAAAFSKIAFAQEVPVADFVAESELADIAVSTDLSAQADTSLELKEDILDGIAYALINAIIAQLADSLTAWINNGFQGSPGFISNPSHFFLNVANEASAQVIQDLNLDFLCEPFTLDLNFQLGLNLNLGLGLPTYERQVGCTVLDILNNKNNFQAFVGGDFNFGVNVDTNSDGIYAGGTSGMAALLSISAPENNPVGAWMASADAIEAAGAAQASIQQTVANWGNGFKSVTDKIGGIIQTPGVVVEQQLNDSLASGQHRIEAADEINEVVGALLGALLKTVTSGLSSNGGDSADFLTTASYSQQSGTYPACAPGTYINADGTPCDSSAGLSGNSRTYPDCPAGATTMPDGSPCKIPAGTPPPITQPYTNSNLISFRGAQTFQGYSVNGTDTGCTYSTLFSGMNFGPADNAVDGSQQTLAAVSNCAVGAGPAVPYFWQVTLPQATTTTGIQIDMAGTYQAPNSSNISSVPLPTGSLIKFFNEAGQAFCTYTVQATTDSLAFNFPIAGYSAGCGTANPIVSKVRIEETSSPYLYIREVKLFRPLDSSSGTPTGGGGTPTTSTPPSDFPALPGTPTSP